MFQIHGQLYRPGELQEKILRHICKTKDSDYKALSKETDRDRITIKQSLDPLIKRHYITAEKVNPPRLKSKLIFRCTQKGVCYSIAFLGVTLDDIQTTSSTPDELKQHQRKVRTMNNPLEFTYASKLGARQIVENDLFDDTGNFIMSSPVDYFKQTLRIILLEATKDKYYDPTKLFDPQLVEYLKRTSTKEVLKIYKQFLTNIRDNIDSSIRLLPG